jgi:anti-sigma factor RsiW
VSHLGRWLSALVDGELDGTERDRVLNHVAGCTACRQEANAMRALKRRLTALGDSCAESSIAGRLIELARGDQAIPAGGILGAGALPAEVFGPRPGRGGRHRPGWKIAAGSATSALLTIGAIAFVLGNAGGQPPAPKVVPSVDSYLLQHSYDAGQAPASATTPVGGTSAGGQGSAWYFSPQATPPRLDPRKPGTVQLGQLAEPVGSVAGTTLAARPPASVSASPAPVASATASPAASASAAPGGSPRHPRPASRSQK